MFNGVLKKMITEFNNPINYFLDMGSDFIVFDSLLNKNITIKFEGYSCLSCNSTQEIYRQGYCKRCFFDLPSTADWVIKPELSKAHLGIQERDIEYEKLSKGLGLNKMSFPDCDEDPASFASFSNIPMSLLALPSRR